MAQAAYQKKLDELRQAFDSADTDSNGKLTEAPFKQFVELGFKKPCPDGMYGYLCDHFAVAKSDGLSWDNALQIWKQSNPPPKGADNLKAKTSGSKPSASGATAATANGAKSKTSAAAGAAGATGAAGARGRGVRNLGDDGTLATDHRTRSPSPGVDRVTASHRRDTSLSGSMGRRRGGTGSYRDLSNQANHAVNGTAPNNNNAGSDTGTRHARAVSGSLDSDLSDASVDLSRSASYKNTHRRESSRARIKTMLGPSLDRRTSNGPLGSGDDASSMVVQMIEQKLKNATAQLKDEKKKRKKADETTQQLLLQNEKLKQRLSETETKLKKLEKDFKKAQDEGRKFKGIVDDDRNSMTHLNTQLKSAQEERNEAFKLLRKMEEQHENHLVKLKKKHNDELEKQANGFLQTLGVDPGSGKGVREVIKELKEGNVSLNEQVDMLAETLARKEASLLHALQVLDDMNQTKSRRNSGGTGDELSPDLTAGPKLSKRASIAENFKNNVIQGLAKSKSGGDGSGGMPGIAESTNGHGNVNSKARSPLPAPPSKRRNFAVAKPSTHNADFYRHASSPRYYGPQGVQFHKNSRLNKAKAAPGNIQGTEKTKEKSMEMVNNSLVADVVNKQDAIDELKTANNTLVDQVMNLQKQLDDMHTTSQIFMKKNNMHPAQKGAANGQIGTISEEQNGKANGTTNSQNNANSNRSRTHSRESDDLP